MVALVATPASAASADRETCPAGNLLTRARVVSGLAEGRARLLMDRSVAREGSPWPNEDSLVVLREPLTFDLGGVAALRQLYLQVDADQAFALDLSSDGATWSRLPVAASPTTSGLISRSFTLSGAEARFVKLVPTSEPASLTLTELGVFCQHEAKPRRGLVNAEAPRDSPASSWFPGLLTTLTGRPVITPDGANVLKLIAVALSLGLLGLELRRRRRYLAGWVLLGALAAAAYLNLGSYRYPNFVHDHDVFHYFVGAKYFPELGYDKLYSCSAVAEAEAGFEQRIRLRAQRDLATNRVVEGSVIIDQAASCRRRFSAERWREFRRDVAYFANGRSVEDWHRVLKDHGFNASPTWIAMARALSSQMPATESTIGHKNAVFAGQIGPLDPLLLLLSLAAIYWAFGLRTAALVAIVFACNPLSEFAWMGGGFLRQAWLSTLAIGLSLVKKQQLFWGGASIALSALLQLFPVVSLAFPVVAAVVSALALLGSTSPRPQAAAAWGRAGLSVLWSQRGLWRLVGGAAMTLLVLVPVSAWGTGSERAWTAFAANTAKHDATPSGNLVGLGTLLSYRASTNVDVLFDARAADPFARARAARLETRQSMRPIQVLVIALGLGLSVRGLRKSRDLWWTGALGLFSVLLALETSCYYTSWLCVFVLVGHERDRLVVPILGTLVVLLVAKLSIAQLGVDMAIASAILLLGVAAVLLLGPERDWLRSGNGR